MNDLLRELAPVSDAAWSEIETEARRTLELTLAARKLVDFSGPEGWAASAVGVGRTQPLDERLGDTVESRLRQAQPLVEARVPFEVSRAELEAIGRGAKDPDLEPVTRAAREAALAEDRSVFHGYAAGGIRGLCEAATNPALSISDDYEAYPGIVAQATSELRTADVNGPYGIALGPDCYVGLHKTIGRGGRPVIDQIRRILDGPVVWAPGVRGAAVLSLRGGDFELTVGQDFSIGYLDHSAESVRLYLQESFTFRVLSPDAAVPLVYSLGRG